MKKYFITYALLSLIFLINGALSTEKNSTVLATGYGISYDAALNNAFRNAIKQYVGIVLDSETILANDKIIKDEILTLSNGNIESYEVLDKKEEDGLFIVDIKTVVKDRNIQSKINEKISSSAKAHINKNKLAEVITKNDATADQKKLFEKYFKSFFEYGYENFLYIDDISLDVKENTYKEQQVDYDLSFSIKFNIDKYRDSTTNLKEELKNIGLKHYPKVYIGQTPKPKYMSDWAYADQCDINQHLCLAIGDYKAGKYIYDLFILEKSDKQFFNALNSYIYPFYQRVNDQYALNLSYEIVSGNEVLDIHSDQELFKYSFLINNEALSYLANMVNVNNYSMLLIHPYFGIKSPFMRTVNLKYEGTLYLEGIDNYDDIFIKVDINRLN